jgi:hypothetical protein
VEKFYIISNQTVGGYAITIGGASGAVITIPNGTTGQVYCDGINFYSAQSSASGSFYVNGVLTVTGATTLGSTLSVGGALTYGGVTLNSAVTGTGNMALSASPTFTGAPLAPTATAGTNTTQIATTGFVSTAITNLSLGTMSNQNSNSVVITGGSMSGMSSIAATTISGTTITGGTISGSTGTFSGDVYSSGNVTAYSDERLKSNWRPVQEDFVSKLAQVKSGIYDRTDVKLTQAGVSAQELQKVLAETVVEGENGMLSVNYGAAALVAAVELAKEVTLLRAEIAELKKGR